MTRPGFRFSHYDLKAQPAGTIVEIAISCVNNVRLLDAQNYELFKTFSPHKYLGGLAKTSPVRLVIPAPGYWHVIVDMDGHPSLASSKIKLFHPRHAVGSLAGTGGRPDSPVNAMRATTEGAANAADAALLKQMGKTPDDIEKMRKELDTYKRIANTDELTGLGNRRAFDTKLTDLFNGSADRANTVLALAQIDRFKEFNVANGHAAGDFVLKGIGNLISANIRDDIQAARLGGAAFSLIIEGNGLNNARHIVEHLQNVIEDTSFTDPVSGKTYGPVSISSGLCAADMATNPEELFRMCDVALNAPRPDGLRGPHIYDAGLEITRNATASGVAS